MKKLFTLIVFICLCHTTFAQWQLMNPANAFPRSRPATFVIKDTAYLGNGDAAGFVYAQDFHGYTQNSNAWVVTRPFPGGGGDWGIRFQIGDTAYIGGGANPSWQNDFWKYDPKNGWKNIGNTPHAMQMAYNASFVLGNKGYVCSGNQYNTPLDSVWEYDPIANTWASKAPLPVHRYGAAAFAAKGYGYVGLGGDGSGTAYKDMYRYDPLANKWDTMAPMPAAYGMEEPGFFVLCGKLVVTMGDSVQSGTSTSAQTWLFDPFNGVKGTWTRLPNYPGTLPSYAPGGFVMGDTGFIYGGWNQPDWMDRSEMYSFVANRTLMHMLAFPLDTVVCAGSSVTLRGTASLNYLWNTPTTDTTANVTVAPLQSTTYVVTETSGACVFMDTLTVEVTAGQSLTATADPAFVCSGSNSNLAVTNPSGNNYVWLPAISLQDSTGAAVVATPTVTTTYTVMLPNGGGCASVGNVTVTVGNASVGGTVTAERDTICQGTTGLLTLSGNSSNILQWQSSTNDTDFTLIANAVDTVKYRTIPLMQSTFYVVAVGSGSCTAYSDTLELIVPPSLTALFTPVTAGETVTFNSTSTGNVTTYYWDFGDGTTSTQSNPTHTYTSDTTVYVCLTIYDGSNCSYTFCRDVALVGVQNISAAGNWNVYPSPFSSELNVEAKSPNGQVQSLEMYDVLGRVVLSKVTGNTNNSMYQLNTSSLAKGMYYLQIKADGASYIQKVVKQ